MDLLIEKTSPYVNGAVVVYEDGTYSLDPPDNPKAFHNEGGEDIYHTIVDGETLESISYLYYKTSAYWHMLSTYNVDVWDFDKLETGKVLLIPHPTKFSL